MPDWVEKLVYILSAAITAIGGKSLYDFFVTRHKTNAEARQIETASDKDLYELSEDDAREYRKLFRSAETEIRSLRLRCLNMEIFIRELLHMLRESNHHNWETAEKRFNDLFPEGK